MSGSKPCIILVTGKPGIGKTTLVSRVFHLLHSQNDATISISGFVTEEIRRPKTSTAETPNRSPRIGFDIVQLTDGNPPLRAVLARLETPGLPTSGPRVGQYVVDLDSFEGLVRPTLQTALDALSPSEYTRPTVCIVDEIGKMELTSRLFNGQIRALINRVSGIEQAVLLATVPSARRPDGRRGIPLVDELCDRADSCLIEVTHSNRDKLAEGICQDILNRLHTNGVCNPR